VAASLFVLKYDTEISQMLKRVLPGFLISTPLKEKILQEHLEEVMKVK